MTDTVVVGMGEMQVARCSADVPVVLKMTVGSCVGLFLADRRREVFGAAHIMIPDSFAGDDNAGKYADTAFPELLRRMRNGVALDVEAYVVGGACMFRAPKPSLISDVGQKNVDAVLGIAERLGIPVVFRETGGNRGRSVLFSCPDSHISVRTLNQLPRAAGETSGL